MRTVLLPVLPSAAWLGMLQALASPPVDTTAVWKATVAATTPNQFVDGTHPQSEFGHLMGGYDAGYYGYLWSKVFAQDMFTVFQRDGLESPAAGMRYRKDIGAEAGRVHAAGD